MSKVINQIGCGGSAKLNFSVNNYDQEKTTAGTTNEIQVYPVTTMNSWKIQAEQPSNPSTNDVWLKTGTGWYEFQPVANTDLKTPISGAKLWNGTAWVEKNTKCYTNGAWQPAAYYFYNNGDNTYNFAADSANASIQDGFMYVGYKQGMTQAGLTGSVSTATRVDLRPFSKLCALIQPLGESSSGTETAKIGYYIGHSTSYSAFTEYAGYKPQSTEPMVIELDISGNSVSDCEIRITHQGTYADYFKVYQVWGEY